MVYATWGAVEPFWFYHVQYASACLPMTTLRTQQPLQPGRFP